MLSSSSESISSRRGIATAPSLLNNRVSTSTIALRTSNSSLSCKRITHFSPNSWSFSMRRARHPTTLAEISSELSLALLSSILPIPNGSNNSLRSSNNLHHSTNNSLLFSSPSSRVFNNQIAASVPLS